MDKLKHYTLKAMFYNLPKQVRKAMLEEFDPQERIKKLTVLLKKETTSLEIPLSTPELASELAITED